MLSDNDADIAALSAHFQRVVEKTNNDDAARKKLFGVAMGAAGQLESPLDACWKMIMSPHAPSAMMALLNMGVMDYLASATRPVSAQELGEKTNADPVLIVRLLRPLVPIGFVKDVRGETYESTPSGRLIVDPVLKGGYNFMFECATHALSRMPSYFERNGYKNVEGNPGPFQYTKNTDLDLFYWLMQYPKLMTDFNTFMKGQQAQRGDWFHRVDMHKLFLSGAKSGSHATLLVDVGGGEGHDIQAFHRAFPNAPGKLVLQDQAPVIQNIRNLDETIVKEAYDFFAPQPRKGARGSPLDCCGRATYHANDHSVYYLRSILHDWADSKCLEILKRIGEAMEPGYSKLLLNEFILPAENVPLYPALLDINMMAILNGE
ncbi:MAG: hypothetical protein Q9162_003485 [Coniocarpon cinnabarinum]